MSQNVLPQRMREARRARRITQAALAERLGVKQSTVAGWETGKSNPSVQQLKDVALLFRVSVDSLLGIASEEPARSCDMTPVEREVLDGYRALPEQYQILLCRMLKVNHPADQ